MKPFIATALSPPIVATATKVALLVGTLLIAINHLPALLDGSATARNYLQMGLTYLVPYCVSTYSATVAILRRAD
ncbi:nitrate/nitrite transporter NrtS [Litorivivens sp.]|uniref:nitrate/nitrite transporter NrtS n=1 Tax=Litorivivens sp. TaxID=2020868 RepID=UPI003565C1BE